MNDKKKDFKYINLSPFKWFCLNNFPFLDVDFDAITEYQLFCKLGKELNNLITKMNELGLETENLSKAFNDLQSYINNYFNNLDVQDEINNKLNQMVEDGTIAKIINPLVYNELNYISNNDIAFTSRLILKNSNKSEIELKNLEGNIQGLCYNEDKNEIYRAFISNNQNGGVNKYNASTGELLATTGVIENFGHSNCLCYYDNKIYVTNSRVGAPSLGGLGVRVLNSEDLSILGSFKVGSLGSISGFCMQNVNNENPANIINGKYSYVLASYIEAAYRPKISLLKSCNKITNDEANFSLKNMSPYRSFNYDHNLHTTQGLCLKYPFIFVPLSGINGQGTNKIAIYNMYSQKIGELIFEDINLNLLEIEDIDVTNNLQNIYVGFNNNKLYKFYLGTSLSSMAPFQHYSAGTTTGKYPLTCLSSYNPENQNNTFITNTSDNYQNIKLIKDIYFTPFNYNSSHIQGNKVIIESGLMNRTAPIKCEESKISINYKSNGKSVFEFILINSDGLHKLVIDVNYNLISGHILCNYYLDGNLFNKITDEIGQILAPGTTNVEKTLNSFVQIYLYSTGYSNNDTFYNGSYSYEDLQ